MNDQQALIDNPNFRANVGIMIVNSNHNILAGEAFHYPGEWMMPQGGIDQDESPYEAMVRELGEETGLEFNQTRFIREHDKWLSYQLKTPLVKDGGVYTGQRQKWFLLEYEGLPPNAELAQDREFSQFDWVNFDWLLERTATFKIDLYKNIHSQFKSNFP